MTRTGLDVPDEPDEPDEPFGHVDGAFPDAWSASAIRDYVRFLRREQPTIRPATYADKGDCFMVKRSDGSYVVMATEVKSYRDVSLSADDLILFDPYAAEILKSFHATHRRELAWYTRVSPQKLTSLAVFIAGRERSVLGSEWRSHLSGEKGSGLSADRQVREAAGFVIAAIRYRLQDTADFAWRPVDAVLASRKLSNLFVLLVTLLVVMIHVHHGGLYELADNLEGEAVVWGAAFGLIHAGRWWRDVKPPEHKPRKSRQ